MKDKNKITVGDIVNSKVWKERGLIVENIRVADGIGLVINGMKYHNAEHIDFRKIGITTSKHNEIIERDYIKLSEHRKEMETQRNCYADEYAKQLSDYDKYIEKSFILKSESIKRSDIEAIKEAVKVRKEEGKSKIAVPLIAGDTGLSGELVEEILDLMASGIREESESIPISEIKKIQKQLVKKSALWYAIEKLISRRKR